jgi:hypothetical protein
MKTFLLLFALLTLSVAVSCEHPGSASKAPAPGAVRAVPARDTITAALVPGKVNVLSNLTWVSLGLTASSSQGTIIREIWDCDNGSAPFGADPLAGPFALPAVLPGSGSSPVANLCGYAAPGMYKPTVKIIDSKDVVLVVSAVVTVKPVKVSGSAGRPSLAVAVAAPAPAVAPPIPSAYLWRTVTLTASSTAGNIIEETWNCDNGLGPYDSNLPAGAFLSNTQTQNCGYRAPGKYWPVVTVTDSAGNVSSAHVLITIPAPALPAKVSR